MKKALVIVLVTCIVCTAVAAIAQPRRQEFSGRMRQSGFEPCGPCERRGHRLDRPEGRPNMSFAPEMTPEIRTKVVELKKLRIDLEEALTSDPINKSKAIEVFGKIQTLEKDIAAWRFSQKLERIEKFQKMPKPEPKPE